MAIAARTLNKNFWKIFLEKLWTDFHILRSYTPGTLSKAPQRFR